MSRTRKGTKAPGWEPRGREKASADSRAEEEEPEEDNICPGCSECECVKCGGFVGVTAASLTHDPNTPSQCFDCGWSPELEELVTEILNDLGDE